jgi:hypothetical protein
MRNKKYYVLVIILIGLVFFTDYNLSFYGRGSNILKTQITYGYNLDFDNLEGFKIEEEEFIQVIGQGTKMNNSITVNKITKYSYNLKGVFCEILDSKNKLRYIKVTYDKNRAMGDKISYDLINKSEIDNNLIWYNVIDSRKIQYLLIINFILKLSLFFLIVFMFIVFFKKNKNRE